MSSVTFVRDECAEVRQEHEVEERDRGLEVLGVERREGSPHADHALGGGLQQARDGWGRSRRGWQRGRGRPIAVQRPESAADGLPVGTAEFAVRRPGAAPATIVEQTGVVLVRVMPISGASRTLELDSGVATDRARLLERRGSQVLEVTRRHMSGDGGRQATALAGSATDQRRG